MLNTIRNAARGDAAALMGLAVRFTEQVLIVVIVGLVLRAIGGQ